MNRKAIILAGGKGTRLYPSTLSISKQILPIYDKPMIYYAISVVMLSNIKEILIISSSRDLILFKNLLGDGSQWGLNFKYEIQAKPHGIAQALLIARDFLQGSPSMLILGDNLFYGANFSKKLIDASTRNEVSTIFSYTVNNPERYGVIEYDYQGKIKSIKEKPLKPKSNSVVTGLYFFDKNATNYAQEIKFSKRKELEITDLINIYLSKNELIEEKLTRGFTWLDTGTHEALLDAQLFVQTIEKRQGIKIACPEEIAYSKKWITKEQLKKAHMGNISIKF